MAIVVRNLNVRGKVVVGITPTSTPSVPASQGPLNAGTLANDSSIGTATWTISGTQGDTSLYASEISKYLKVTNFGFSIPNSATISGIIVTVDRVDSSGNGSVYDYRVRIVKNGTIGTTDKSSLIAWSNGFYETINYGSSSDLWGETWSFSDINSSTFGIAFSAIWTASGKLPALPSLKNIKITVHYTT